jgi:hypothetical protein
VFASGAPTNLFLKSLAGDRDPRVIFETSRPKGATDWSKDGHFLLFRTSNPKTGWDLMALPLEDGTRNPIRVADTTADEREGQFSPDGRWVAYQSNESGRFEIYVQPFPGPGDKTTISTNGGAQVRWRRDGRELFYIALDDRLMAVRIQFRPDGLKVGAPTALFPTHVGGAVQGANMYQYVVSSDGQRFLMNTTIEQATPPIIALLNWSDNH